MDTKETDRHDAFDQKDMTLLMRKHVVNIRIQLNPNGACFVKVHSGSHGFDSLYERNDVLYEVKCNSCSAICTVETL